MIFLDATGTCRSRKNTGMQRMTRQIFLELKKRTAIRPLCWNTAGNCYQQLGRREIEILETPFRIGTGAQARPDLRGENFLAELDRLLFRKNLPLRTELKSGDVFLVPDLYRDQRVTRIPELLRETRARSVAIFHDAASLRLGILSKRATGRFHQYINSLGAFDLVICISRDSRDDLHRVWGEIGTKSANTCVEPWPIEFADEFRATATEGKPRNLILCVGSFEPRKNHLTLLRAAEKLWKQEVRFELELIGRATGYYGPKIRAELRRLQRMDRPVRWLRHVDEVTLHHAYELCRFSIYPSLTEGFGLPVLESLWHGKPCVCGSNGALGEVAKGGGCFLVDQTSEDSLSEAIRLLLTNRREYDRLCMEARVREFRTWDDYINSLLVHLHQNA